MKFSPEQLVVAPGTKPLLLLPMLALLGAGDEVIYPDPGFPSYEAVAIEGRGVYATLKSVSNSILETLQ